MQSHILPTEDLAGIYRFAMLLTGAPQPAQAVVLEAFADAAEKIHHFRNGKSCEAWLVAKVRNRLLNKSPQDTLDQSGAAPAPPAGPGPAALELAARFSKLSEPGRSALALLYTDRFSLQEIAQILQLPLDALAAAVDSARVALQGTEAAGQPAPASAEEASS